jgi:hypothetical protein
MTSEKAKHVTIDVGGATPVNLHFHAGSKDNVEAIITKLKSSKALSDSSPTPDASISPLPRSPSPEITSPREAKKAQVHFSPASPVIIPPRDDDEDDGEEDDESAEHQHRAKGASINGHSQVTAKHDVDANFGTALYDFTADGNDELSIVEGERLIILERDGDEWWKCRNSKGKEGVVPASYIEVIAFSWRVTILCRSLSPCC